MANPNRKKGNTAVVVTVLGAVIIWLGTAGGGGDLIGYGLILLVGGCFWICLRGSKKGGSSKKGMSASSWDVNERLFQAGYSPFMSGGKTFRTRQEQLDFETRRAAEAEMQRRKSR